MEICEKEDKRNLQPYYMEVSKMSGILEIKLSFRGTAKNPCLYIYWIKLDFKLELTAIGNLSTGTNIVHGILRFLNRFPNTLLCGRLKKKDCPINKSA